MSKTSDIKEAIRAIANGGSGRQLLLVGTVKATDGETCTVDIQGLEIDEVRLTAVNDGTSGKLLLTPATGSYVLMADLSGGELRDVAVVGYTQLESVETTCEQITLNGGSNGGLVNIEQLKNWMQSVEKDLQTLQTLLKSSPIAGNGAPAAIAFTPQTKSVASDIEDETITH